MKRSESVVFVAVMVIAIAMRLYGLSVTPPGLYPDEAMNGNNALAANRTGEYRLFYPENNGREGLFINLQAASVAVFGNTPFALRFVSAVVGILTVLGVYLLTRRMFDDWRLAALAAFLISVGFWHVNFSRIGFRAIMTPLFAVWGFYYLYKGIETHRLWHWGMSGALFGLGFHTYISFRILPLSVACVLVALWLSLRAAFSHGKYSLARHRMLGGVMMMIGVMIIVLLPMAAYFYSNPQDLMGRTAKVAVWASDSPVRDLAVNAAKTFGMFFVRGDTNWRHNIAGDPILFWPVAAFFAVGLFHTIWRFGHSWRTRGHPGVVQTLLLSWFFVGLLPSLLSTEGSPHALRALVTAPAVYILAAVGLHWLALALQRWYCRDEHRTVCLPLRHLPGSWGHRVCVGRSTLVVAIAVGSVLCAVGIGDAARYFSRWATEPAVADEFTARYLAIADRLSTLPPSTLKYVVVTRGDVFVNDIPMSAQTVMFLTDTWLPEQQHTRNIFYLTKQQFDDHQYPRGAVIIELDPTP